MSKIHYFLSGTIAVGKSECIKTFMEYFGSNVNVIRIKEYIDYDENGENELLKFYNGEITPLQFQLYILDQFEKQLNTVEYEQARVVIWERHPIECLDVFSNNMDEDDKKELIDSINMLIKVYNVPEVKRKNELRTLCFNTMDVSPIFIAEVMYDMLSFDMNEFNDQRCNCCYIFLYFDDDAEDVQMRRIRERGRKIEIDYYNDINKLKLVNRNYYNYMYKYDP